MVETLGLELVNLMEVYNPGCTLAANLWYLSGQVQRPYYAVNPMSAPKSVNITITIPAPSLILPEPLSVLEVDEVQSLDKPDSPHIRSSIF